MTRSTGMKVLFLDIDGVLNRHQLDRHEHLNYLHRPCVENLNHILQATGASIVVSSSWRYMILRGDMTLAAFERMMISQGAVPSISIIGATADDAEFEWTVENRQPARGRQIRRWLGENRQRLMIGSHCVLDDEDDGISLFHSGEFVQTHPREGLTAIDAERAIEILNRGS